MLDFIESKKVDWIRLASIASINVDSRWANGGPLVNELERRLLDVLDIPKRSVVVACASGTAALFAMIDLLSHLEGRPLTWCVPSFSFRCSVLGPLRGSHAVDCDESAMLRTDRVPADVEGMVVNNTFGSCSTWETYQEFSEARNLRMVWDSAMGLASPMPQWSMVSFHHTKPWGMGEGGCAVLPCEHEGAFRSIINFGLGAGVGKEGFNGKMSDFAALPILHRLDAIASIAESHRQEHDRIWDIARDEGVTLLHPRSEIPPFVPLLTSPGACLDNPVVKLMRYYEPLGEAPTARSIYDRIVCFPCHPGVSRLDDEMIRLVIRGLASKKST